MTTRVCLIVLTLLGLLVFLVHTAEIPAPGAPPLEEHPALDPDLAHLTQPLDLTMPETTVGRLLEYLSRTTDIPLMVDVRYEQLPVSLLGAKATVGEVLSAIENATGMAFRKLDTIYLLARTKEGIAALAHRQRRERWPLFASTQQKLILDAQATVSAINNRLGLQQQALMQAAQLDLDQRALLQAQGYLTIGQLFPETGSPMYDILRQALQRPGQPSLADLTQRRVYFSPSLLLQIGIPLEGAEPYTWAIDLFGGSGGL